MAIDQNALLGLPTAKTSCTSKPDTTTDFPLGTGRWGWASTYQVITRLNPSAAQYGGRMRRARRCAYVAINLICHPSAPGRGPARSPTAR
jgi:hypothetical protein